MLVNILAASVFGGVLSLAGGVILLWKENWARKASLLLLSFATGSLLGAAFLELLPEALGQLDYTRSAITLMAGLLFIFVFEKSIKLYHHHQHEGHEHKAFASTVLLGDAVHNFIDGIVIAMAFNSGWQIGVAATVAIFFHEIPQEIGDFGVLLHSGYKRMRIIWLNLLTSFTTIIGALLGYFLLGWIGGLIPFFLSFAAGIFIYIAVSDLLPELKQRTGWTGILHIIGIVLGIAVIWGLGIYLPE